jgi:class 3 adenylate cyclase
MKLVAFTILLFTFSVTWSQHSEADIRKMLMTYSNDTTFKDLKKVDAIVKEAQNFNQSTSSLADYTFDIVKSRNFVRNPDRKKNDPAEFGGTLVSLLRYIDKWEKNNDTINLIFGYSNIANGLYRLKVYEYAAIYFKRRLNLGKLNELAVQDILKMADSHLRIGKDFGKVIIDINQYQQKIYKFVEENDSLKYAFHKLEIQAYYNLEKYKEAYSRGEQNISYSRSLSDEKQIEAYIYISKLKAKHGDPYQSYIKDLLSKVKGSSKTNRLISESIITFYYEIGQYATAQNLIDNYLEIYNYKSTSPYVNILSYQARIDYINNKNLKSFKGFNSIIGQYKSQITIEDLSKYELYASQAAEKIGKKNIALNHLKRHLELTEEIEAENKKEREGTDIIMYWFRNAKNNVEFASRKNNFNIIGTQNLEINKKADSLKQVQKDYEQSQQEVQLRKYGNRLGIALIIVAIFFIVFIYISNKKNRNLILNILPAEIANKLKSNRFRRNKESIIRDYSQATVLFTDFKGFTMIAEELTPDELVNELNECFGGFDEITAKYNLEKIKTIGDAYMAVGGIPVENKTNPVDAILAAMDVVTFIDDFNKVRKANNQPLWNVRIGINTGHIVAGIIGTHKYSYDVWGDAVNLASRMESSGEPGKINISENTYELVKDQFECTYRGEIEAKNKGKVKMYFVDGLKK